MKSKDININKNNYEFLIIKLKLIESYKLGKLWIFIEKIENRYQEGDICLFSFNYLHKISI